MHTHRLISYDLALPGGFCFEQHEGVYKKFPCLPTPESQAQAVSSFRLGNNLPRATVKESLEDVDFYQCQRLGFHRNWVIPTNGVTALSISPSAPIITPCKGCGGTVLQG